MENSFARLHFGWSELRGFSADGYTVIDSPKPELYAWEGDPHQTQDIAQTKPELINSYLKRLNSLLKTLHKTEMVAQAKRDISNEAMRKIEALGYLSLIDPKKSDSGEIVKIGGINPADKKFFQYNFMKATDLIAQKKYDQGLVILDKMLESDPENKGLLMLKSDTYTLAGDNEKARGMLLQVLELNAEFIFALQKIAWLEFNEGNLDKAENYCRKAIDLYQSDPGMYRLLAEIMVKRNNWAGAKKMLKAALDIAPSDVSSLFSLGKLMQEEKNYVEAIKYFEEVLRRSPDNIWVLNFVGKERLRTGDREGAIRAFTHAAELAPREGIQQYHLGIAYETGTDNKLLGPGSDPVAAQSFYQRALELNPELQQAKDRLSIINKASIQKRK
jgi:tetratricopeptide (TPR) repeat protein